VNNWESVKSDYGEVTIAKAYSSTSYCVLLADRPSKCLHLQCLSCIVIYYILYDLRKIPLFALFFVNLFVTLLNDDNSNSNLYGVEWMDDGE
jgi:hypothetical protein